MLSLWDTVSFFQVWVDGQQVRSCMHATIFSGTVAEDDFVWLKNLRIDWVDGVLMQGIFKFPYWKYTKSTKGNIPILTTHKCNGKPIPREFTYSGHKYSSLSLRSSPYPNFLRTVHVVSCRPLWINSLCRNKKPGEGNQISLKQC